MSKINWKQNTLGLVLLGMIIYAFIEYGIAGGIFLIFISMIILAMFFKGLSENNLQGSGGAYIEDGFGGDIYFDPMLSVYPQNVYHRD